MTTIPQNTLDTHESRLLEQLEIYKTMLDDHEAAIAEHIEEADQNLGACYIRHELRNRIASTNSCLDWYRKHRSTGYIYICNKTLASLKERYEKSDLIRHCKAFTELCTGSKSTWSFPKGHCRTLLKNNVMTLATWYMYFDSKTGVMLRNKDRRNWYMSYYNKPKFSIGDIVSLRSNIPEQSVHRVERPTKGNGYLRTIYYHHKIPETLMIIGIGLPDDVKWSRWIKPYSVNSNGGMRFYKVIPMGKTDVYYIIERSLKINRTKAIKDAKK